MLNEILIVFGIGRIIKNITTTVGLLEIKHVCKNTYLCIFKEKATRVPWKTFPWNGWIKQTLEVQRKQKIIRAEHGKPMPPLESMLTVSSQSYAV